MRLVSKLVVLVVIILVIVSAYYIHSITPRSMEWVLSYDLSEGTESMVKILTEIDDWVEEEELKAKKPSLQRKILNFFYVSTRYRMTEGIYHLQSGNSELAVEILSEINDLKWNKTSKDANLKRKVNEWLAIAYMRYGEEQNCILNHDGNSCLLPIQGTGVYELTEPTVEAIGIYEHLLTQYPDDYRYRWLLNIAYQTLGKYPESVPEQWLINPEAFKDGNPADNFSNIAPHLGVDHLSLAGGACLDDFDNDGYLDMIVSGRKRTQLTFYANNGQGGFVDKTKAAKLNGLTGGFNLFQTDYNNDGNLDLFVARGAWLHDKGLSPNSLLRNNGDGTFSDVTVEAGLLAFKPTLNAVWSDFNNDGWLDLFVGNETSHHSKDYTSEFYLNNHDGTFTEMSEAVGLDFEGFVKGASAGDFDNDGWIDLFVSNKAGDNFLFKNLGLSENGQISFVDVAGEAGVSSPDYSFTSWFWDFDNDGDLDLYVSVYGPRNGSSIERVAKSYDGEQVDEVWPAIFRNNGNGTFTNIAKELGMNIPLFTMGANYADLNNDGFLDIYLGTGEPNYMGIYPNRMFYNNEGKYFEDVTSEKGVGHIQKGHGVSIGDIDNDGDQDILAQMGGMLQGDTFQNALFQNPGESDNNWVTLRLTGVKSNRNAIGARVKLIFDDEGHKREIYRSVSSGGSFGANSLQLEIGLSKATVIEQIEIIWPGSGSFQKFENVRVNQIYSITEDLSQLTVQSLASSQSTLEH